MMNSFFQGAVIMCTPPAVIYPSQGCIDTCRKGYRVDTIGGRRDGDKEKHAKHRCASSVREMPCQVKVRRKSVSKGILFGIRESKKTEKIIKKVTNAAVQTEHLWTGTSEDEMDINTLNSCPAVLHEPKKGLELVTHKTEPYRFPFSLNFIQIILHPCSLLVELQCC